MNRIIIAIIFTFSSLYSISQTCEWATTVGGSYFDFTYDLVVDYRNNVVCIGRINNSVDFNPAGSPYILGPVDDDIFIAKYDPSGVLVWARLFEGVSGEGTNLATDDYGNIFAVGNFHKEMDFDPGPGSEIRTAVGYNDGFLLKLNSFGEFEWVKIFQGITDEPDGLGTGVDPEGLGIDVNGNLFVTGSFGGMIDFDPGPDSELHSGITHDFYVQKLNSDGEFVWLKTIGPVEPTMSGSRVIDLKMGPLGHVHVTGTFRDEVDFNPGDGEALHSTSERGAFVLKLDNNGDYHWSSSIEGGNINGIQPLNIEVGYDGSVYTSGNFKDDIDFDPSDDELILESTGWISLYIQKLNSSGDFEWANVLGISDQGLNAIMEATPSGNLAILGSFKGTIDMDPDEEDTYYIETNGGYDVFLADMDSNGELISAISFGGEENDYARGITMSNSGYFYLTGSFRQITDFDHGPEEIIRTSNGDSDVYLVKMGWYLSLDEQSLIEDFSIYPNPANNFVKISGKIGDELTITDLAGSLVFNSQLNNAFIEIDCNSLSSGLYFVKIQRNETGLTQKLIVQ